MSGLVSYEVRDDIALIGLNRPAKRNAINNATIAALHEVVQRTQDEAKAGVIFGHGAHFCAGLDLAELVETMKPGAPRRQRGRWHPTFDLIARGRVPFVAAIHGACVGGGLELASAAHVRVADASAFFALPEARRGIFVGGGGSVRVQRLLGYGRMADMMLTGRVLTVAEAERFDLCQYVVPAGGAMARAEELARTIAANAPLTNWAICAALPRVNDLSHDDGLFVESLIGASIAGADGLERVLAFVEKRVAPLRPPDASLGGED
jgi:(methylthio)acryloyl-CoA hydratase